MEVCGEDFRHVADGEAEVQRVVLCVLYLFGSIASWTLCCGSALFVLRRVCVQRGPYCTVAFDFRVYA